jgi:hypothetical protein
MPVAAQNWPLVLRGHHGHPKAMGDGTRVILGGAYGQTSDSALHGSMVEPQAFNVAFDLRLGGGCLQGFVFHARVGN